MRLGQAVHGCIGGLLLCLSPGSGLRSAGQQTGGSGQVGGKLEPAGCQDGEPRTSPDP